MPVGQRGRELGGGVGEEIEHAPGDGAAEHVGDPLGHLGDRVVPELPDGDHVRRAFEARVQRRRQPVLEISRRRLIEGGVFFRRAESDHALVRDAARGTIKLLARLESNRDAPFAAQID